MFDIFTVATSCAISHDNDDLAAIIQILLLGISF